jgi:hypothetical protein
MAKKIPVIICKIKQINAIEPKFHQYEKLAGLR